MRPLRNFIPGLPVHLMHRGNNRPIFTCTGDFLLFLRVLEEACQKFHVAVHAYVLMTNHFHLLLTPQDEWGISKALQSAMRRYVGYFNKRHRRRGTLWEGRFLASVIDSDHYLFACHRYIDMNPVRAAMVARPEDYVWSSHRHYAYADPDTFLSPHPLIAALGGDCITLGEAYRKLFELPELPGDLAVIRGATRGCRRIEGQLPQLPEIARRRGRPRRRYGG